MKKKYIVLIGLLFTLAFFNFYCKNSSLLFDINGTWEITLTHDSGVIEVYDITFSGSQISGSIYIGGLLLGSYTINNDSITFSFENTVNGTANFYEFEGEILSLVDMEGEFEQFFEQAFKSASRKALPIRVPVSSGKWKGKKR